MFGIQANPINLSRSMIIFLAMAYGSRALAQADARALLEASAQAMGGNAPSSSEMKASISISEGSRTRAGTIHVITQGIKETSETIDAESYAKLVVNDGVGWENDNGTANSLSKELAVSTFSVQFPLVLVQSLLADPDTYYEYIEADRVSGHSSDHIRVRNTYASQPELQPLSPVTTRDIWIDRSTRMPLKVAFKRFFGRGATYPIPCEVAYSDFRVVSGVAYPFHIEHILNGTAWATIVVNSVVVNAPVAADAFIVQ